MLFIIKSEDRKTMDQIITEQEIMGILGYNDIFILRQLVPFPENHHGIKRHGSGHDDLYVLEFINMPDQLFGLVFAMFAYRVEQYQQDRLFLWQI